MFLTAMLGNGANYITMPKIGKVIGMKVVPQTDVGAAGSVTLDDGTNDLNLATSDGDLAGILAVGVVDTVNGADSVPEGTVLTLTCASTNNVGFFAEIEIDEFNL